MGDIRTIVVASGNAGKIREIAQLLGDLSFRLVSMNEFFGAPQHIEETGTTFEENARLKATWVHERSGEWALADDSGLEVEALGGAPGVYSARFAGEKAGDAANVAKLLEALRTTPPAGRAARFRCVVALAGPEGGTCTAEGVCRGSIVAGPRGTGGFGYDPVFVPEGFAHTFAELDEGVKNAISHRGKALVNLRKELVRIHERA